MAAAEARAASSEVLLASSNEAREALEDEANLLREQVEEGAENQRMLEAKLEEADEHLSRKDERIHELEHKLSLLASAPPSSPAPPLEKNPPILRIRVS